MLFQPDPSNDNQVLIPQSRFCESSHMWYFAGVLFAVKGSNILLIQNFHATLYSAARGRLGVFHRLSAEQIMISRMSKFREKKVLQLGNMLCSTFCC